MHLVAFVFFCYSFFSCTITNNHNSGIHNNIGCNNHTGSNYDCSFHDNSCCYNYDSNSWRWWWK